MKCLWVVVLFGGASLGCASAPQVDAEEPAAAELSLCATWVSAFDPEENAPCVPREGLTPEQLDAVQHATSSVADTMSMPRPVCPADPEQAKQWKEMLAGWVETKGQRVLSTQRELEQLARFDLGFVIGAGSLAALYEHYALQALTAPRPSIVDDGGIDTYRGALMQLFGPWTQKAREAYQTCATRALETGVIAWADFCRARLDKLEARIDQARSSERCPDRDPAYQPL